MAGAGLFHILIFDTVLNKQTGFFTGHVAEILTAHTTHRRLHDIFRTEQAAGSGIHFLVKLGVILPVGQHFSRLKFDFAAVAGQFHTLTDFLESGDNVRAESILATATRAVDFHKITNNIIGGAAMDLAKVQHSGFTDIDFLGNHHFHGKHGL